MSVMASEYKTELGSLVGVNRTVAQLYEHIAGDRYSFHFTSTPSTATKPHFGRPLRLESIPLIPK